MYVEIVVQESQKRFSDRIKNVSLNAAAISSHDRARAAVLRGLAEKEAVLADYEVSMVRSKLIDLSSMSLVRRILSPSTLRLVHALDDRTEAAEKHSEQAEQFQKQAEFRDELAVHNARQAARFNPENTRREISGRLKKHLWDTSPVIRAEMEKQKRADWLFHAGGKKKSRTSPYS